MVQWTRPTMQFQVAEWSAVGDKQTAAAWPRRSNGATPVVRRRHPDQRAIDHALTLFARGPFRASRRVIDVSGDGSNNRGRPVTLARDKAVAAAWASTACPSSR